MSVSKSIAFSNPVFSSATLPALDCINLMRDRESRAILVTDGVSSEQVVVGIFTESDLVRNFSKMRMPEHRFLPIRDVMKSPVITLPASKIAQARDLMASRRIRTIPLLKTPGLPTASNIVGMVNAFDLVNSGTILSLPTPPLSPNLLRAVLISHSPKYAAYLEQCFVAIRPTELIHLLDLDPELVESMAAPFHRNPQESLWTIVDCDHFSDDSIHSFFLFMQIHGRSKSLALLFDEFLSGDRMERMFKEVPPEIRPALVRKPASPVEWKSILGS